MKNNRGISEILILLVVVGIFVAAFVFFIPQINLKNSNEPTPSPVSYMPSASPVSDSGEITTLEEELTSTTTGSVDEDINSMSLEADSL